MVVPDASRSRHGAFLKRSSGFSTQVRNGICCRKAIPTTKRYIGRFQARTRLSGPPRRSSVNSWSAEPSDFASKVSSERSPASGSLAAPPLA